jgi:PAS domain-containing protein
MKTMLDALPNPIFHKNSKGVFTGFNTAYEKAFDVEARELLGKTVMELEYIPIEDRIKYNKEDTETSKGQQEANPEMTMLVYREMSYPAREVQGKDGNYLVSVERLEQELLDGIRSLDPAAFDLDEEIAYYCSDEEIRLLTDDELEEMIYG